MAKKKETKTRAQAGENAKKSPVESPRNEDAERPYGGLPDRDLKKNLGGC